MTNPLEDEAEKKFNRHYQVVLSTPDLETLIEEADKRGYSRALEEVISYVDEFPSGDVIHIRSATLEFLRSLRVKGGV